MVDTSVANASTRPFVALTASRISRSTTSVVSTFLLAAIAALAAPGFFRPIRIEPGIAGTLLGTIVATGNVKDDILMLASKTFTRDDAIVNRSLP